MHIPKTGGTTLNSLLEAQFSCESIFNIKVIDNKYYNTNDFISLPESKREKISYLSGHMSFGLHNYMVGNAQYITMLRQPVARIVSFYYHVLGNKNWNFIKLLKQTI